VVTSTATDHQANLLENNQLHAVAAIHLEGWREKTGVTWGDESMQ